MTEFSPFAAVITQPFMQRALLGGLLTGALGGLLGSFAVLRQLSFFSDALGHSALLGLSLGILLGLNPTLVLIPFAVLVNLLVQRSQLPTDALLNIVYSTSLAFAVVALSLVTTYTGGIQQLLFGDILGISWLDLGLIAALLLGAVAYLLVSLRAQVLVTLQADLAGAFVVIPACPSRLVSRRFGTSLVLSSAIGGGCAVLGLPGSGLTNLPSGPCVVLVQFAGFLLALMVSQMTRRPTGFVPVQWKGH